MHPINRIEKLFVNIVGSASHSAAVEQMLPSSRMSAYDPTAPVELAVMQPAARGTDSREGGSAMEVSGAGFVGGAGSVRPVQFTAAPAAPASVDALQAPQDEVFISPAARMMQTSETGATARAERLAEIRSQISQGIYDSPEKLALAVDRLIQDLVKR